MYVCSVFIFIGRTCKFLKTGLAPLLKRFTHVKNCLPKFHCCVLLTPVAVTRKHVQQSTEYMGQNVIKSFLVSSDYLIAYVLAMVSILHDLEEHTLNMNTKGLTSLLRVTNRYIIFMYSVSDSGNKKEVFFLKKISAESTRSSFREIVFSVQMRLV